VTDHDRVTDLCVAVPRAPCTRPGTLRVWPRDPRVDLGPLVHTSLSDDQVVQVLRRLARGEDAGVDLEAHRLTLEAWAARRRPLAREGNPARRKRRKARKRKGRKR